MPTIILILCALPVLAQTTSEQMSPLEVLKIYYQAADAGDIQAAKQYLSKGTLALISERARRRKQNLDDLLKKAAKRTEISGVQFSNEQVTGERATVEITVPVKRGDAVFTMPFVKEEGNWKIAMDKFAKEMLRLRRMRRRYKTHHRLKKQIRRMSEPNGVRQRTNKLAA